MIYAIVGLLAIILDQYVKYWVAGNILIDTGVKELIPGVISLVNIHNTGAAFGILSGSGSRILFIAVCIVFTLLVIVAIAANWISGPLGRWSAVLVAAGGIGNCIDRVLYGYVQDMFSLEFMNFAIFNVADIFITVFCFVFILYILFGGEGQRARDRREMNAYGMEEDEEADEIPSSKNNSRRRTSPYEDSGYEDDVPVRSTSTPRREEPEQLEDEPEEAVSGRPSKSFYSSVTGKPSKKERQAAIDDEYEQFKAQRAERIRQMQEQDVKAGAAAVRVPSKSAAKTVATDDPFAEWERANAAAAEDAFSSAEASVNAVPSAKQAHYSEPAAQTPASAAPVEKADDSFDIDDILKEFDL